MQASNVLGCVSSCIASINDARDLLQKKADFTNRVKDARQGIEDLGETLDDMKEGTDMKLIVVINGDRFEGEQMRGRY